MSSENEFDEIEADELVESESLLDDSEILSNTKTAKKKKSKMLQLCPTLIVATCIFVVTLLFFTGWKCFFDDSIFGTWTATYEITSTDTDTDETTIKTEKYSFTFEENNVVSYHYGGMTVTGRYFFVDGDEGQPQIQVVIYNSGNSYINVYFDYTIGGNIFTGRTLSLVDRNGLLFTPKDVSDDSSSINNRSVTEDNVIYYICDFEESGYEDDIPYYDDFETDDALEGSWLYEYDGYKWTYTFYDDGSFEILKSDGNIKGGYTVSDGTIKFHYYCISLVSASDDVEAEYEYSVADDVFTLLGNGSSIEFSKTSDKYDYMK